MNFQETNKLIGDKLQSNEPFSCIRIDNTSGFVMDTLFKGGKDFHGFFSPLSLVEGGVYPNTIDYGLQIYAETEKVLRACDILGFVDISGEISRSPFIEQFGNKPMFFGLDQILVMDPAGLLGHSWMGPVENPWTKYLKGKKVLVISTHVDSIKHQWKNIDAIWGDKKDLIVPFELVDVIRSPYHPAMDDRQYPNCKNWGESVSYIMNLMDSYDYDVLLTGATTSSPFYAQYAKERGKVGIQTGGVIQLFFGVYGYRWTEVDVYKGWHAMYNEHWMYPLKSDEPQKRENYGGLETGFAYWGRK
jgi:hypothetical protein